MHGVARIGARLNSGQELGLLHHLVREVVVELVGVVLDAQVLWVTLSRHELVGFFELLQAVSCGGRLLTRFVVGFLFNPILLEIDRINCFCSWVFNPEFLRGLADRHVLDVDLDDQVTAHLVVTEVVVLHHAIFIDVLS